MSEKHIGSQPESLPSLEQHEAARQLEKATERLRERAEQEATSHEQVEREKQHMRTEAQKEALSGRERAATNSERQAHHAPVHRSVKQQTYRSTMRRVEAKLPPYQRTFSRFINNTTVDHISNVTARTVARPSGVLGGGIVSVVILVVVTFYAHTLGFTVSPLVFCVSLAIGWIAGLVCEAIWRFLHR